MRVFVLMVFLSFASSASASEWRCQHENPDREDLTFTPNADGTVAWEHEKLGLMEPLKTVVNSDDLLTMATQQVNILYSRFFHLDKFSGRMGETAFRGSVLRRLAEKDPDINWSMITTVWLCKEVNEIPK